MSELGKFLKSRKMCATDTAQFAYLKRLTDELDCLKKTSSTAIFQQAVFAFCQAVSALARIEAMKTENRACVAKGYAESYDSEAFFEVSALVLKGVKHE
jgi:hypothetical protein